MSSKVKDEPVCKDCELKFKDYENLLSFIRSKLDVIGTSIYLLENNWSDKSNDPGKYFKKINDEMELIRKLINI
jgi:hypothetical protein